MPAMIIYSLTITSVKLSLLLLYKRIFNSATFRRKLLVVGLACIMWFLAEIFAGILQCRPFRAAFDSELLFTDHCISLQAHYWGIAAANLSLDVVVLCLPIYEIWQLHLNLRQKVELISIFLLGGL